MKQHLTKRILVTALALILVFAFGAAALAEGEAPEAPATDATPETSADTALQEALEAYRSAKQSNREKDLQSELDAFVANGSLTQEQADLIMKYYQDQQALRNGVCPNCGYQFPNNSGKAGRSGFGGFGGQRGAGRKSVQPGASQTPALPESDASSQVYHG